MKLHFIQTASKFCPSGGIIETIRSILEKSTAYFSNKHLSNPRFRAEQLIADGLGMQRMDVYLNLERPLTDAELETLRSGLKSTDSDEHHTIQTALAMAEMELDGIPDPGADWLLSHLLNTSPLNLKTRMNQSLSESEWLEFKQMIARRKLREPVQYITGTVEFFGLNLRVNKHVLIPRPETERLVELILERFDERPGRMLDVGTGSGCIALAVKSQRPDWEVVAVDQSQSALQTALKNADMNGLDVDFRQLDVFAEIPPELGMFSLIISNPPYVATSEMTQLEPELREFEPTDALTDQSDGLRFYRRFAEIAPQLLSAGGHYVFETGTGQHAAIRSIFSNWECSLQQSDYHGHDRYIGFHQQQGS